MSSPRAIHGRMLEDYVSLVRRRWLVVALSVTAGIVLSLVYMDMAPKTYVSSAKVLVKEARSDSVAEGSRTNDSINLDTEAQLVKSLAVATIAGETLDSSLTPVQLARRVTVTVPPNTTVLDITFAASTSAAARDGAAAFADAYLANRERTSQASVDRQVESIQEEIDDTSTLLADTNRALVRGNLTQAQRAVLEAQRETLTERMGSLNTELAPLNAYASDPGAIIFEAQEPKSPRDPNPMLVLPSGLFVGLLVGLALAMWRERMDQRVHEVADIDRIFGLTPLAELRPTVGVSSSKSGVRFDVRALYHSLRANGPEATEVVLLVAPDAVRTAEQVSEALGVAAARSGATTVYLANEDDPSPASLYRQRSGGVLRTLHYVDIGLVTDGEINASQLQSQVNSLRADNDFVVLGLPTNDLAVDLPMLSRHVDVVVLLIQLGRGTRTSIAETLRTLRNSGAKLVFAVTVDKRRRGRSGRSADRQPAESTLPDESAADTKPKSADASRKSGDRLPAVTPEGTDTSEPTSSKASPVRSK